MAGGKKRGDGDRISERYARFAKLKISGLSCRDSVFRVWLQRPILAIRGETRLKSQLTNSRVCEHDERIHVIEPLDLEAALVGLPILEDDLDIARLKSTDEVRDQLIVDD